MAFVKVVRVLEYYGLKEWAEGTMERSISHGTPLDMGRQLIREVSRVTTKLPDCETCGGLGRMLQPATTKLSTVPPMEWQRGIGRIRCLECDGRGFVIEEKGIGI